MKRDTKENARKELMEKAAYFDRQIEIENSKFGQYYHITSYVSKTRAVGNFRVFKEKDIKYETPEIIDQN